jgi:transcriptional regulator of acetoin/glycerol metabolism
VIANYFDSLIANKSAELIAPARFGELKQERRSKGQWRLITAKATIAPITQSCESLGISRFTYYRRLHKN